MSTQPPSEGAPRKGKWVGQPLKRREEARLVRGQGLFVDDYKLAGMVHLQFVRSPYAHARITHVDVSRAAEAP